MSEQSQGPALRVHGSVPLQDRAQFEADGRPFLDLSANVSPYGADPAVLKALQGVDLSVYPDPRCMVARKAVAERFGVTPAQVAIGNGAAELIWTVARALLTGGGRAMEVRPIFGEFSAAVAAVGALLEPFWADASLDFQYNLQALDGALQRWGPRVCYLCSPNNPTGVPLEFAAVAELAQRHPRTVFLLDQAYLGLSPRYQDLELRPASNVICLRSLTKEQGLAGIRVGYMIADAEIITAAEQNRASWMVNSLAQAVVAPAMAAEAHVGMVRERMEADRIRLDRILAAAGLRVVPSEAPFVLAEVADAPRLCRDLLQNHGIAVRDCASFGLQRYVRFSGVQAEYADRLAAALEQSLPA